MPGTIKIGLQGIFEQISKLKSQIYLICWTSFKDKLGFSRCPYGTLLCKIIYLVKVEKRTKLQGYFVPVF